MIVMGIDPGTAITGYAVVSDNPLKAIDYGCIRIPSHLEPAYKYLKIFEGIRHLVEQYRVEVVVVETQYVHNNIQTAIKLGMARGAVLVASALCDLRIVEYAPTRVKKAVCGRGRASKSQVQYMIKTLFGLSEIPQPADAADALALCLCYLQSFDSRKMRI